MIESVLVTTSQPIATSRESQWRRLQSWWCYSSCGNQSWEDWQTDIWHLAAGCWYRAVHQTIVFTPSCIESSCPISPSPPCSHGQLVYEVRQREGNRRVGTTPVDRFHSLYMSLNCWTLDLCCLCWWRVLTSSLFGLELSFCWKMWSTTNHCEQSKMARCMARLADTG